MELILAKVFTLCCDPYNSPYIPIFKKFKAAWEVSYVASSEDWKSYPAMNPSMKQYSDFSMNMLNERHIQRSEMTRFRDQR